MALAQSPPLAMPTAQMPLTSDDKGTPSQNWWRFWYGLYVRTSADIPYLVTIGITAAGATQANATGLTANWNEVTTTAANTGVRLFTFGTGFDSVVWNIGANALKVYPPVGFQIDALGANNPYSLSAGKSQSFYQLSSTQFRSLQLG